MTIGRHLWAVILSIGDGQRVYLANLSSLYSFQLKKERGAFRVLCDKYVTEDTGTGIVHQAPYFGEDDFRICMANGIIRKDTPMVCPVDPCGRFTAEITEFAGNYVKDADKAICQELKRRGRLIHQSTINHSYPFCWRSDTPLIYRALPTWFIRVQQMVDQLLENNEKCHCLKICISD
ncbi:unnamed protein product [Echinostoma caproni]|uniref:tRNA-synt_1 domain-containing protein n=1 Tax=Echinostoma caproni TaxID=27848 RepID=A0A183B5M5_9TREM|nr:unnamed protein product [Echinostoma caproni]